MTDPIAWLTIIGINENGLAGLTEEARAAIADAELVAGGKRHLDLVKDLIRGETLPWPSPPHLAIPHLLAAKPKRVCVLCSGDPFHYGMGSILAGHIPMNEIHALPAPPITSLVAARTGWALQHTVNVALHGRPLERIIPHLQPGARIIALSADETTPAKLAALLKERGFGASRFTLCERLGGTQERIRTFTANSFPPPLEGGARGGVFSADAGTSGLPPTLPSPSRGEEDVSIARLNCLALEIPTDTKAHALPITSGLADDWFEHDGQITKREIRAATLSTLSLRRGELLWDIGLGAGSVAIEWLLRDPANRAIGFEKNSERAHRAARNAKKLGVPQLVVLEGAAPAVLEGLESPDAIFIGGGASPEVLDIAWNALKPGGRLVMNAVSLETESLLLAAHKRLGGELIRIAVERADAISATMTGWRPAMTVTQWSISK